MLCSDGVAVVQGGHRGREGSMGQHFCQQMIIFIQAQPRAACFDSDSIKLVSVTQIWMPCFDRFWNLPQLSD